MALDQRIGTKIAKHLRREDAASTRVDPYPYIGIVKNNYDPTRAGRLQVFIPDLGGDEDDQKGWRTVSYASPFMGYTSSEQRNTDPHQTKNAFDTVTHSYGFWAVPPDIGVEVLVIFVAGDPTRGYWLACVNSNLSRFMIPGVAGSTNVDVETANPNDKKTLIAGVPAPVAEFNENNTNNVTNPQFYNLPKPVHTVQYGILKSQGLDRDTVRGATTSSSQRETPSRVFGISTPGRPLNDPADDGQYVNKLNAGTIGEEYFKVKSRKGGHQFIMDDGAMLGQDQLVRLRTAKGHQILMHDTAGTLYISHADGTSWIELTPEGAIKAYSKAGFHVRSEGSINFHSDASINFESKNNINFRAANRFQVNSTTTNFLQDKYSLETAGTTELKIGNNFNVDVGAKTSIQAGGLIAVQGGQFYTQSGGTVNVKKLKPLQTYDLPDTSFDNSLGVWLNKAKALNTIVTAAPSHEPYYRGESVEYFKAQEAGLTPQETYTGGVDAIKNVRGSGVQNPAKDTDLRTQPVPKGTIGNLDKDQLQAYMAQVGKSESGGDYTKENTIGFVGKYQFGYQALIDQGYVKASVTSNAQLNNPNSWTGKDGISDKSAWLNNGQVQEEAMFEYTQRNYNAMVKNGAITKDMPPEEVGGMLATSHLLGAGGAKKWRTGAGGADAYGTTGDSYFQKGKYAVAVLGPKMPAINAG